MKVIHSLKGIKKEITNNRWSHPRSHSKYLGIFLSSHLYAYTDTTHTHITNIVKFNKMRPTCLHNLIMLFNPLAFAPPHIIKKLFVNTFNSCTIFYPMAITIMQLTPALLWILSSQFFTITNKTMVNIFVHKHTSKFRLFPFDQL